MEVTKGLVVRATAGKEKGSFFVVVSVHKDRVSIADGRRRRLSAPKQKNIRHIQTTGHVICLEGATDKTIRGVLKQYE